MQAMREELSELHEKFADAELDAQASQRQLDAITVQIDETQEVQAKQQEMIGEHGQKLEELHCEQQQQQRHEGRLDVHRAMIDDLREQLKHAHEQQSQQKVLVQRLMQQDKQLRSEVVQMEAHIHRQQEQLDVQSCKMEVMQNKMTWLLTKLDRALPLPADDVEMP